MPRAHTVEMPWKRVTFAGLDAVELATASARMTVVTEVGPRIAAFGRPDGASLLYWDADGVKARGAWKLRGGHRLWTTRPGADEAEETYRPDNAACRVEMGDSELTVEAPPTSDGIVKSLCIRASTTTWTIEHRIRNTSDMLWSGGIWALTCARPDEHSRFEIPLDGGNPTWDVLTYLIPRRWGGGHTSRVVDDQIDLQEDRLVAHARGGEAKRMLFAPRGELSMIDAARGRFTKCAAVVPGASYPLGTNVALYLAPDAFMVELETMSPTAVLAPGETFIHVETWALA